MHVKKKKKLLSATAQTCEINTKQQKYITLTSAQIKNAHFSLEVTGSSFTNLMATRGLHGR
jgi:hypothetical protein